MIAQGLKRHTSPQTLLSKWHRITPENDKETTKMSLCFYLITLNTQSRI